jgi:hypothetical protein
VLLPILVACGIGLLSSAADAATCTTVTRRNLQDPDGAFFGNRYSTPVAINAAGDVLFSSRPRFAYEKLYLAKASGTLSIIARSFGPLPNGDLIVGGRPFARSRERPATSPSSPRRAVAAPSS